VLTCVCNSHLCDGCAPENRKDYCLITGARSYCIQCSKGRWNPIDICLNCVGKEIKSKSTPPKHHTVDHNLLQFRMVHHRRTQFIKQRQALKYLESSHDVPADDKRVSSTDLACCLCTKALARPFWRCLDCKGELVDATQSGSANLRFLTSGNTFICFACNVRIEDQRPWLFEYKSSLDASVHHWSHTLVSLPAHVQPKPPALSVHEQRLARVEKKLDERARDHAAFAEDMNSRMGRLETLLSQLIGARGAPS
jgi:hypothetical protein